MHARGAQQRAPPAALQAQRRGAAVVAAGALTRCLPVASPRTHAALQYDSMSYALHTDGFDAEAKPPSSFHALAKDFFKHGTNHNVRVCASTRLVH